MRTVVDLFETFGGPAAVGRIIARRASTASEMKRRRSVPTRYWPALISAAREKGIDLDEATLVRIHLPPPPAPLVPNEVRPETVRAEGRAS